MKNTILLFVVLLFASSCELINSEVDSTYNSDEITTIIYCTPDLKDLAAQWVDEFCSINPDIEIRLVIVSESSLDWAFFKSSNLCFVTGKYAAMLKDESVWEMVVGRDIVVPLINSKNPFLNEIYQQGISSEDIAQIFEKPESHKWGTLIKSEINSPVNYYMTNDESINLIIADFLKVNQNTIDGIKVESGEEMISSIQKDPLAIGFCKLMDAIDLRNQSMLENVILLPIDRNGNGKIDPMEKIYDDLNVFSRGVWIGKYPRALINNIYSVSQIKPTNETDLAFLKWVLTDGQEFVIPTEYSDLLFSERQSKIGTLYDNEIIEATAPNSEHAIPKWIIITMVSFVLSVVILKAAIQYRKHKKASVGAASAFSRLIFDEDSVLIPRGLYYDKTHTWAFMEKDGMVKIGLDDFLQHITGPLTRVKMKNSGDKIKKGQEVLSIIQNGKQLNIYAPISGTIKAQNSLLNTDSSIINSSPYTDGWVYLIEPTNWIREIQFLIMEKKYKEWLKSEFTRLKDFIAACVKPDNVKYSHMVLQDGGELRDGILAELRPEDWEDFQTNFIDPSN